MEEIIIPGQKECSIDTEVMHLEGQEPFVCMTVSGPDNALCMRMGWVTLKLLRARLQEMEKELRKARNTPEPWNS